MPNKLFVGYAHVCPTCGKTFWVMHPTEWVYKRYRRRKDDVTTMFFCSWSCLRKFDKSREEKQKKKKIKANHYCSECRFFVWNPVLEHCTCDRGITLYAYDDKAGCGRWEKR